MKLILSLVALSALSYDAVLGFNVHQALTMGSRVSSSRSTLSMNIESKETKEIKVGVIGCGRIGVVHLEAITKAPGVRAVIVSNPTVSKAEKAAKQFNVARWTNDAMEVITDPEVDAVWICSPSSVHAEQIKAAAANGKHVFCEKPIATDLPETVEAINACNEAGVKLMIGLQRRFDQNFKRVQTAVKNKEVGEPIMVRAGILHSYE
jgi:myo-inositol 2-dehydrogenase / D-chiro-inositol 1-dehydrogenase